MKVSQEEVNRRRNYILMELKQNKEVFVKDLAKKFNTTEITIRRDLLILENDGYLIRFYGGAKLNEERALSSIDDNIEMIAKCAATYVEDNDTLFINTSSTALAMIPYITARNVKIFTNNAKVTNLEIPSNIDVFLTGGEVRCPKNSLTGDFALATITQIHASKCFIGCSGISEEGITTIIPQEVIINHSMIERSKTTFILAEHHKIGSVYDFSSGDIADIDYLICDYGSDEDKLKKLSKKGVKIIKANEKARY